MLTNEQWIVYLWSIYPDGGFTTTFILLLLLFIVVISVGFIVDIDKREVAIVSKLGKYLYWIPATLLSLLFLASLVPDRNGFMYILATPYVVDGGKNIVEMLDDNSSKLYKLNKLIDGSLDNALKAVEETK